MKRILVYPGSVTDLLSLPALIWLGYKSDNLSNPGKILVRFNGMHTHSLRKIVLPISAGFGHYSGSIDGDRRAIEFECHIGSYLDPRNEGIALILPLEVEFLNSAGIGRHQWRPISNPDLLCS